MIQGVQEQELALTSNTASIPFDDTDLRTNTATCCGWLNHNEGSAIFTILAGGYYEITFNTNVTSATAGNTALALFVNGVQLEGTEMDRSITTAGVYENVAMSKRIRVCGRGQVTLTVNSVPTITYDGTSTPTEIPIIKNANISIKRLS